MRNEEIFGMDKEIEFDENEVFETEQNKENVFVDGIWYAFEDDGHGWVQLGTEDQFENEGIAKVVYEIRKNEIEVKHENEISDGCTLDQADQDPEVIETYATADDALEALKKFDSSTRRMSGYYLYTEYYVEKNMYDVDGDWVSGGDVLEFSK